MTDTSDPRQPPQERRTNESGPSKRVLRMLFVVGALTFLGTGILILRGNRALHSWVVLLVGFGNMMIAVSLLRAR